jgi:tRNA (guanosine-2'-O-)-methyltransferase
MKQRTQRRQRLIEQVLARRQPDFTLIIDNIFDPHNVSAILRSCDAFGVGTVHLYYSQEDFPVIGRKTSASAGKWVEQKRCSDGVNLLQQLSRQGYQIAAACLDDQSRPVTEWDLSRPTAVILGNEHRGVSPELRPYVTGSLFIPMQGMVQSLNVSVAAAVILYEGWRQRDHLGMYGQPSFDQETFEQLKQQWSEK